MIDHLRLILYHSHVPVPVNIDNELVIRARVELLGLGKVDKIGLECSHRYTIADSMRQCSYHIEHSNIVYP